MFIKLLYTVQSLFLKHAMTYCFTTTVTVFTAIASVLFLRLRSLFLQLWPLFLLLRSLFLQQWPLFLLYCIGDYGHCCTCLHFFNLRPLFYCTIRPSFYSNSFTVLALVHLSLFSFNFLFYSYILPLFVQKRMLFLQPQTRGFANRGPGECVCVCVWWTWCDFMGLQRLNSLEGGANFMAQFGGTRWTRYKNRGIRWLTYIPQGLHTLAFTLLSSFLHAPVKTFNRFFAGHRAQTSMVIYCTIIFYFI